MKKIALALMLMLSVAAAAQTTAVTATVVDSDSTAWANGTWTLSFVPAIGYPNVGSYTNGGSPLSPSVYSQSGTMSAAGLISFTTYDSTQTFPLGSSWMLVVCPQASVPCTSWPFSTAGASQDFSSVLSAFVKAPRFHAVSGTYGYSDTEAQVQLSIASTYWNVNLQCQRVYSGGAWGCSGGGGGAVSIQCNGTAADATVIQNVLNSSNTTVLVSGTCGPFDPFANSPITVSSNKTLKGPAIFLCSPTGEASCVINPQSTNQTVAYTFTDAATTAGSHTVTSAGSTFPTSVIGASLRCLGAYGTGSSATGSLSTTWSTWITNTGNSSGSSNTLYTGSVPFVTFTSGSPTTCTILLRDHDITIDNIQIQENVISISTCDTGLYSFMFDFRTVNKLTLNNLQTQTVGGFGCKGTNVNDASNLYINNHKAFSVLGSSLQDGVDIGGPLNNFYVYALQGVTNDNLLSLVSASATHGLVTTGTVEGVNGSGGFGLIQFNGDNVEGFNAITINSTIVNPQRQNTGAAWTGYGISLPFGVLQNTTISDVSGDYGTSAVSGGAGIVATNLRISGIQAPLNTASSGVSLTGLSGTIGTYNNLIINGIKANNGNITAGLLVIGPYVTAINTDVSNIQDFNDTTNIAPLQIGSNSATNPSTTLNHFVLHDSFFRFNNGSRTTDTIPVFRTVFDDITIANVKNEWVTTPTNGQFLNFSNGTPGNVYITSSLFKSASAASLSNVIVGSVPYVSLINSEVDFLEGCFHTAPTLFNVVNTIINTVSTSPNSCQNQLPQWLTFRGDGSEAPPNCAAGCNIADEHWYSSFTCPVGQNCINSNARPLIIRSTGTCTIAGTLSVSGSVGGNTGTANWSGAGGGGGFGAANGTAGNNDGPLQSGGTAGTSGVTGGTGGSPVAQIEKELMSGFTAFSSLVTGTLGTAQMGGSSGGAGGSSGGAGGRGGELLILSCQSIVITGTVDVSGANGGAGGANTGGGGGGGGGIFVAASPSISNTGTITTSGGLGGLIGTGTSTAGGPGGAGWSKLFATQ